MPADLRKKQRTSKYAIRCLGWEVVQLSTGRPVAVETTKTKARERLKELKKEERGG